jgi:hypothetical protein
MGNLNSFQIKAVVANERADGIIGLDFLKDNDCIIDIVSKRLVVGKKSFNVHFEGPLGCYRVVASETVSIPPMMYFPYTSPFMNQSYLRFHIHKSNRHYVTCIHYCSSS